ncbi:hypothetical protein [Glutamicibacter sp. NPDC087344]|uniref:hypothetical protein n=1 Tax=Glutamicibacter sp. NPDC087344 TaxID=3363994 RepID=UPI003801C260
MSTVRKYYLLLVGPCVALLAYAGLYLQLREHLPQALARHLGPDGIGYTSTLVVVGSAAGIAVLAFGIGAWTCLDFTSLGHWYTGNKSIVVCSLAAGYGVLGLGVGTMASANAGQAPADGASTIGWGLLALLIGFSLTAVVLSRVLPAAQRESLS